MAVLLFLASCFTDFLDGYLARKLNILSNFGAFLDPVADKVNTPFFSYLRLLMMVVALDGLYIDATRSKVSLDVVCCSSSDNAMP